MDLSLEKIDTLISYKRLCTLFSASQDLVQAYCHYLQEALLEASELYPHAEKLLIACECPKTYPAELPTGIKIIPLWQALLNDFE